MRVAVPAYFHPSWGAHDWSRLCSARSMRSTGLVVLNPDTGVGASPDRAYREVCARLRAGGVPVAGYVDTAYGRRAADAVLTESATYRERYELGSVFLDQVPTDTAALAHYGRLCTALADEGLRTVLNPGTRPAAGYLDIADTVVEFENTWQVYRTLSPPTGRRRGRASIWHLVHATPAGSVVDAVRHARRHEVDLLYVTDATVPNPWDRLPAEWWALQRAVLADDPQMGR